MKQRTPRSAFVTADRIQGVHPPFVGRFSFASRIALEHPDRMGPDERLTDFARCHTLEDSSTLGVEMPPAPSAGRAAFNAKQWAEWWEKTNKMAVDQQSKLS